MTEKRVLRRTTELKSSRNWENPHNRRYNAWSPTELNHLLAGFKKHGSNWSAILQDREFSFRPDRVPTDLFRKRWKAISFRSEQPPTNFPPEVESAPLTPKESLNTITNTESATEFHPEFPINPVSTTKKSGIASSDGRETIPQLQKRGGKKGIINLMKSFEGNKESEEFAGFSVSKTPTSSKKIPISSKKTVKETPAKGKRKIIEVLIKKPVEKIANFIGRGDAQNAVLSSGSEEKPTIDKIVDFRIDEEGKEKVLVVWGGMKSDDSPTWESIDSLDNCSVKLQSYLIENRQRVSQILVASPTKVTTENENRSSQLLEFAPHLKSAIPAFTFTEKSRSESLRSTTLKRKANEPLLPAKDTKANKNTSSQLLQLAPHLKSSIPAHTFTEKSQLEYLRWTPLKRKTMEPLPMEAWGYIGGKHSSSESNSLGKPINTTPPHRSSELPESVDTIGKINVHMRKRRKLIATLMSEMKRNHETRQENNGGPSVRRTKGYDKSSPGGNRQQSGLMTKLALSPITKPTEVSTASLIGGKSKGQKGKEPVTSRIQGNSSLFEETLQSSLKEETKGAWDYRK